MKTYFIKYYCCYGSNNRIVEESTMIDVENPDAKNILNTIKKMVPNLDSIINIVPLN